MDKLNEILKVLKVKVNTPFQCENNILFFKITSDGRFWSKGASGVWAESNIGWWGLVTENLMPRLPAVKPFKPGYGMKYKYINTDNCKISDTLFTGTLFDLQNRKLGNCFYLDQQIPEWQKKEFKQSLYEKSESDGII